MVIDFKEIPKANVPNGMQDHFELFSRDFLKAIGYKIILDPSRGQDGKKDLIVSEIQKGISSETTINWLVSCKHYAHSGSSVKDVDEPDIIDRVNAHKCHGFIGIYSTLPSSSLSNKLFGYKDKMQSIIFDSARIEDMILNNTSSESLFLRYFPKSYEGYHNRKGKNGLPIEAKNENSLTPQFTKDDLFHISKSAILSIEFAKVRKEFRGRNWTTANMVFEKLHEMEENKEILLIEEIMEFLGSMASMTRADMPLDIAESIYWCLIIFFPSLYDVENKERSIDLAGYCAHIGYNIAYDACIHVRNLALAQFGLMIIKFVYRSAKESNTPKLIAKVNSILDNLNDTLHRPGRDDLGNAIKMVTVFRASIEEWDLNFPDLPDDLQKIVEADRVRALNHQ